MRENPSLVSPSLAWSIRGREGGWDMGDDQVVAREALEIVRDQLWRYLGGKSARARAINVAWYAAHDALAIRSEDAGVERAPDFKCWCGGPYVYHSERWGSAWGSASMPLYWHPFEPKRRARVHD